MVWVGISITKRTELIIINGNLIRPLYQDEILMRVAVPFLCQNPNLMLFHQDNVRPHTSRIAPAYMYIQQEQMQTLPWPAFSPDMSHIEYAWDELGRRVHSRQPQPTYNQQVTAVLVEEWRNKVLGLLLYPDSHDSGYNVIDRINIAHKVKLTCTFILLLSIEYLYKLVISQKSMVKDKSWSPQPTATGLHYRQVLISRDPKGFARLLI